MNFKYICTPEHGTDLSAHTLIISYIQKYLHNNKILCTKMHNTLAEYKSNIYSMKYIDVKVYVKLRLFSTWPDVIKQEIIRNYQQLTF